MWLNFCAIMMIIKVIRYGLAIMKIYALKMPNHKIMKTSRKDLSLGWMSIRRF